jgi:hypothetical protein
MVCWVVGLSLLFFRWYSYANAVEYTDQYTYSDQYAYGYPNGRAFSNGDSNQSV